MLNEFLKNNILLTDGAMGTYYRKCCKNPLPFCELENLHNPEIIEEIHKQYIRSGARLIRTNTFNANTEVLETDFETVKQIITAAYKTAERAVNGTDTFIGCSIGPNAKSTQEYISIADTFLELGADIFVFETFSNMDSIAKVLRHIKSRKPTAFILMQFALTDTGTTTAFVGINRILQQCSENNDIDAMGFNCGIGPKHMENILSKTEISHNKPVSALPNAGYPEIINGQVEYVMNPVYFAELVSGYKKLGIRIIGGCCGTTPEHIELLRQHLNNQHSTTPFKTAQKSAADAQPKAKNAFHKKIDGKDFLYAVELDPPFKTNVDKLIDGARALKTAGVDIITIADSPMGKPRVDSTIISAKIRRETGMEVLPHICCRDRNIISLRSTLLGAYVEDIRNVLVVTGDPVPTEERSRIKSVFNFQSYSLMNLINEMNYEVFAEEPMYYGGAVNFNVKNKDAEYSRLLKKLENGAKFFLTQPVFTEDTIEYIKALPKDRNFKILGGIMPLVSFGNAQFINNEMAGINIPDEYVEMFSPEMSREEAEITGKKIAVDIARKIKPYIDGFYFIAPFNRYNMIIDIIKEINQ